MTSATANLAVGAKTTPLLTERVMMLREQAAVLRRAAETTISERCDLARVVDDMLDEIDGLSRKVAGVGDAIAHELRTPLTRTRAVLERGRFTAQTLEALQLVVDRAMAGLDRAVGIITALLRIATIEHSTLPDGFQELSLTSMVSEVAELYQPLAEVRDVVLIIDASVDHTAQSRGDPDLVFEAIANLVDNAIKFTPPGGRVELALKRRGSNWAIRVADSGPGIPEAEREAVTRPFYRLDANRHSQGLGLGLTLVAAIAKLHGFQLSIGGSVGCVIELTCASAADA